MRTPPPPQPRQGERSAGTRRSWPSLFPFSGRINSGVNHGSPRSPIPPRSGAEGKGPRGGAGPAAGRGRAERRHKPGKNKRSENRSGSVLRWESQRFGVPTETPIPIAPRTPADAEMPDALRRCSATRRQINLPQRRGAPQQAACNFKSPARFCSPGNVREVTSLLPTPLRPARRGHGNVGASGGWTEKR